MLSSQYIRENTDRIKSDLALRGVEAPIDEIVKIDKEFRAALTDVEELRAKRKVLSKEISGQLSEVERNERIQVAKDLGEKLATKEEVLRRLENNLKTMLYEVPNIIDPSTPRGSNETDNIVIETVGKKRDFLNKPKPHWELSVDNIGIDLERAAKLSGSRFFILNAGIARLQRGLIQWM
ncbi:MAG: serine--tRNA ligase, partial [Dehalococcoidia bacterium]|nr:serine--tRNA ligase [Dehalococcoidia bacterium]